MFASNLKRVRRRVQRLRCERSCSRQIDSLAHYPGMIVTTFYDVEGGYARAGETPKEIETLGRILEIEKRYAIRSTYNVVARFALDASAVIAEVRRAGNEIASHSYDHPILTTLDRAAIAENVCRTKGTFENLGIDIRGHRSPQSDWDDRVLEALVDHGYTWSAEDGSEPYPYRIRQSEDTALWRFPIAADDWAYEAEGLSPAAMVERWRRRVHEARGRRKHMAIGFHAWVEASPGRLAALDEFFHWLVEQDGVQVMPFGEVLHLINEPAAPELAVADG
jgi:peptidoglycan-N-acetylglucosamine deacetylase